MVSRAVVIVDPEIIAKLISMISSITPERPLVE